MSFLVKDKPERESFSSHCFGAINSIDTCIDISNVAVGRGSESRP
jgi:hypothetical protein